MSVKKNGKYVVKSVEKEKERQRQKNLNKHVHLGIGVYVILLAYLIFIVISFSMKSETSYSVAEPGNIIESNTFTGLIMRKETVVESDLDGMPNFFVPEGEKVKRGTLVSVVDADGSLAEALKSQLTAGTTQDLNGTTVSEETLKSLSNKIQSFVIQKSNVDFGSTYTFSNSFNKSLSDISNTVYLDQSTLTERDLNLNALLKSMYFTDKNLYYAPQSGVISYNLDGFEDLFIDTFTTERLTQVQQPADTMDTENISSGEPLYKVVDNYKWYIAAEIDDVCEKFLEGKKQVEIHIENKNMTIEPLIYQGKIINADQRTYLILEMDRYLNAFINDRFIDFTIIYNDIQGLKIPLSAVAKKDFMEIPPEALISNHNSVEVRKKVIRDDAVGQETLSSIAINIYSHDGNAAYIPVSDDLNPGDTIVYALSNGVNHEYVLGERVPLEGVYVINKGYAAFKLIETLAYTEDYRIISDLTEYGVSIYDRIASDASVVTENQVLE